MITLPFIKNNSDFFLNAMQKRGFELNFEKLILLSDEKQKYTNELQSLQAEKNKIVDEIGIAIQKKETQKIEELKAKTLEINLKINEVKPLEEIFETQIQNILGTIPNILLEDVPLGRSEFENKVVKFFKEPTTFNFKPKPHTELAKNYFDFERASKISGSRFVITSGKLAKLERALETFFLQKTTQEGYTEYSLPVLVNSSTVFNSGQLPKFESDLFKTTDSKYLISTAEVPLVSLYANEIIDYASLPIKMTASTNCFRSEAGSGGKDVTGIIRLHQFKKVEMVSIVEPEKSEEEQQKMLSIAESILKDLEIPYRVALLCSGDTGFQSAKTYDIEVWIPSQDTYREIASCSNTLDFQSQRAKIRYKKDKKTIYPHILNSSALPIGRTLVAILENYQNEDGTVNVPNALKHYVNFDTI